MMRLKGGIEREQRRRVHVKAAIAFGTICVFGVCDFIAALLRDALNSTRIVTFGAAVVSGIAALVLWRESFRVRVPNEELKPTATPSSLVE
jgi:hypothetical protein